MLTCREYIQISVTLCKAFTACGKCDYDGIVTVKLWNVWTRDRSTLNLSRYHSHMSSMYYFWPDPECCQS